MCSEHQAHFNKNTETCPTAFPKGPNRDTKSERREDQEKQLGPVHENIGPNTHQNSGQGQSQEPIEPLTLHVARR